MRYLKIEKSHSNKYLLVNFYLCLFFITLSAYATEILDVTLMRVKVPDHPQRVICLAPSLSELAADLVGLDLKRIVGVSEYSDYPPAVKKIVSIGSYTQINLEKILSLKPDLVLATADGNSKDQVIHLRELGITVVVVDTGDFDQVCRSILLVAKALGSLSLGEQMVSHFRSELARMREQGKSRAPVKVLLQIGDDPLVVVGRKSFLHSALELLGAKNAYGNTESHYPRPSLEDIIHLDPDIILVMTLGEDPQSYKRMVMKWQQFSGMTAVKNKKVLVFKSDVLLRPTLRMIEGLNLLNRAIYGKN